MKTYNEIVDDLEKLEKDVPTKIANASASVLAESKLYTDTKFSTGMKRLIVETLPVENIDTNAIYMVLDTTSSQSGNVYNEYMYIEDAWELIGTTATASIQMYQHCITIQQSSSTYSHQKLYFTIINSSPTPFTKKTLYDFAVANTGKTIPCNGYSSDLIEPSTGNIVYAIKFHANSSGFADKYIYRLDITNNCFTLDASAYGDSSYNHSSTTVTDNVITL